MTDQPFGFKVTKPGSDTLPSGQTYGWGYRVYLPHQCSDWDIVGYDGYVQTSDQAEAVAELERFIAEAQRALTALREGHEFDAAEQS